MSEQSSHAPSGRAQVLMLVECRRRRRRPVRWRTIMLWAAFAILAILAVISG